MSLEFRLPALSFAHEILPASEKDNWPFSGDKKRREHSQEERRKCQGMDDSIWLRCHKGFKPKNGMTWFTSWNVISASDMTDRSWGTS